MDATPKSLQAEMYQRVRPILEAPDLNTARLLVNQVLNTYADKAPKGTRVLEEGFDDVTAVLALPEWYRHRERVIRIFPNRQSALQLLGALRKVDDGAPVSRYARLLGVA